MPHLYDDPTQTHKETYWFAKVKCTHAWTMYSHWLFLPSYFSVWLHQRSHPGGFCHRFCDSNFTTSNSLPSVNHVVGANKNQTGRGKGHEVTDCSLSSVAGHQQPESATSTVSLYVTPIVWTVARAASIIYYLCSLDSVIHPGCTTSSVVEHCLPSLVHILDGADLLQCRDTVLWDVFLFLLPTWWLFTTQPSTDIPHHPFACGQTATQKRSCLASWVSGLVNKCT